ncbi:UDP-N-acetylmuramoyl-L-alanyl-D-glutamate--2,6-diaminopimelate ligase [Magnetovirga frankeli]|uniref:UDP-N-acetylmuramoyl-L-alanyl-D-glutamate--2, 6-diaminopimelate ligase n=1 Tax=Magnetovirga frankeli TaxID=947516 RepID=UPI0012931F38|nr:UDP-N-acetylmuramoyl-L-alanyl-D-glutamate--2,6-diaminopimelate ligase [gamma proteobacterium SS-5]
MTQIVQTQPNRTACGRPGPSRPAPFRPDLHLSDLLEGLPAERDCPLSGISQDSRELQRGDLFLARSGLHSHGLDFYAAAQAQGVAAILAEPGPRWPLERIQQLAGQSPVPILPLTDLGQRASALAGAFYANPSAALRVIGITGTNGKTSCALALGQCLDQFAATLVIGTLGLGRPGALRPTGYTTPDAIQLQRHLAHFLDQGGEVAVMEVSSHALDQGRVAAIHFDTAVFTNLSRDHLDYHGDMARYGQAKARLFRFAGLGLAVINADDPFAAELVAQLAPEVRLALYGSQIDPNLTQRADLRLEAEQIDTHASGLSIRLRINGQPSRLDSPWLGRFNAANLLAVLAVLLEQGVGEQRALQLLAQTPAPPGRMEAFSAPGQPLLVVDYAHTPDALEQALLALREHCAGQLLCVFGCGGERDRGKRPLMGALAERLADRVMLTDDNPRGEDPQAIIDEILAGVRRPADILIQRDRALAMEQMFRQAGPGDVLAICGKGHEDSQTLNDQTRPFSDRDLAAQLLGVRKAEGAGAC